MPDLSPAPPMRKAHYEFIAKIISREPDIERRVNLAKLFGAEFLATNKAFNLETWLKACKVSGWTAILSLLLLGVFSLSSPTANARTYASHHSHSK